MLQRPSCGSRWTGAALASSVSGARPKAMRSAVNTPPCATIRTGAGRARTRATPMRARRQNSTKLSAPSGVSPRCQAAEKAFFRRAFAYAERALGKGRIGLDRQALGRRDELGRTARARQGACDDSSDFDSGQQFGRGPRLRKARRVERYVDIALEPVFAVPVRLAVPQEIEGDGRDHARTVPGIVGSLQHQIVRATSSTSKHSIRSPSRMSS